MWRGRRRLGGLLAVAPVLGACYVYRPVRVPEPQPGTRLALDLNDQGRAALVTTVGPEVTRVEGALVSNTGGEFVIQVSNVTAFHGTRSKWSGETVTFREEYVQRVREKRLSGGRTAFLVSGMLGALAGLVAGTDLIGTGGGGDGKGGGGPGDDQ